MKYSKKAVEERVEKKIKELEAAEEANYRERLRKWEQELAQVEDSRSELKRRFLRIQELSFIGDTANDELEYFKEVAKILDVNGTSSSRSSYAYRGDTLAIHVERSKAEPKRPELQDVNSRELRAAFEVFKTGAPPEVSVTDLRGFGLLKLVQYNRL